MFASGEAEYRELSPGEAQLLRRACEPKSGSLCVREFDAELLQQLHRKGLVYLDIPVSPDDRFSIPPLEVRK